MWWALAQAFLLTSALLVASAHAFLWSFWTLQRHLLWSFAAWSLAFLKALAASSLAPSAFSLAFLASSQALRAFLYELLL